MRLQLAAQGSTAGIAACWYSYSNFTVNVDLSDGKVHQIALYFLDWDNFGNGRSEQVQVLDANGYVLDTRNVSSFQKGTYLVWNVSGDVTFRITNTNANANAVLSGIFLDAIPTATTSAAFVKTDAATQGNWEGVYGGSGYDISQETGVGNPSLPAYASVSMSGQSNYTWASSTNDPRALQLAAQGSTARIAACWYSYSNFTVNVDLSDGKVHQIALYFLDWDNFGNGRSEQVQVLDANGNVLDTRNVSSFQKGTYLVWNVSGDVTFRITKTNANANAVLSGIFLDAIPPAATPPAATPPAAIPTATTSAAFVKTDAATQGNWEGVYGGSGYDISQETGVGNPSLPAYASVSMSGQSNYTWASSTNDPRALQLAAQGSTARIAACWYSYSNFTVNVDLSDGKVHQIALYFLDWDNFGNGRSEQVQVLDANGYVLDTRNVSSFQKGTYLVWNVSGDVTFRITKTNANANAVLSGIFLDAIPPAATPPAATLAAATPTATTSAAFVKTDAATQGNWEGVYGGSGYDISQETGVGNPSLPAYASVSMSGQSNYTWASSTNDPRALQLAAQGSTARIAACWYSYSNFTVNVDLSDGKVHQIALYFLDWDNFGNGRSEQVQVLDANGNVLDTRNVSSFQKGTYLVWNVSGDVTFRITKTNANAVLSGIFLDAIPTAATTGL